MVSLCSGSQPHEGRPYGGVNGDRGGGGTGGAAGGVCGVQTEGGGLARWEAESRLLVVKC